MKAWMIKKPDGALLDFTCSFSEDSAWRMITRQYEIDDIKHNDLKKTFKRQGYRCVRVTIKETT